ncbi:hypothetical protein GW17_00048828 [Ensete ventricosum]|nr:hypothetical protein GW17_00048828 [Ensete ventricosum]RZR84639.1 hypothetical protein BHM03_00011494 [Ensete ventricosum]
MATCWWVKATCTRVGSPSNRMLHVGVGHRTQPNTFHHHAAHRVGFSMVPWERRSLVHPKTGFAFPVRTTKRAPTSCLPFTGRKELRPRRKAELTFLRARISANDSRKRNANTGEELLHEMWHVAWKPFYFAERSPLESKQKEERMKTQDFGDG